ncbi:MAG TPA: ParA family protein, partial [Hyphomicrobiales bacterium]|nr:ParA family protein [Hyphomicrobiales bacterium]
QCEYFALEGLSALSETIGGISASVNPGLTIEGLVRTMFDPRNRLTQEVSDQLKEFFGPLVYRTVIPRNVRLAEAPSYGLPIIVYDKNSTGALAYLALAGELIRRDSGQEGPAADTPQATGEAGQANDEAAQIPEETQQADAEATATGDAEAGTPDPQSDDNGS